MQVVRSSLISALAVLLKRGWLEPGEGPASRAAFFQVGAEVGGGGRMTPVAQCAAALAACGTCCRALCTALAELC